METMVTQLTEIIQGEVQAFLQLLDSLEREREALVRHQVEAVETVVVEQRSLVAQAAALERARLEAVRQLAAVFQEDPAEMTLKRLIERVQGPEANRLSEMRETLLDIQERMQNKNRHNALLIKQSMKFVDKSLQLLTGAGGTSGAYAQSGKVESRKTESQALMNKVV